MRKIPLIPLAMLVLAGPVFAEAGPKPSPAAEKRIAQAEQLIRQDAFSEALAQFIEPTMAEFEKEYAGRAERVYCARSSVETLAYLTESASREKPAIVVSQAYAHAYYLKGYILVDRGQLDAALPFLLKAVELSPSNAQYLSELGHVYQSEKNWEKSLETFARAADAARRFSGTAGQSADLRRALRGQGYTLIELGRFDEAAKLYHQCLELDPGDATAKGELGYIEQQRAQRGPAK